MVEKNNYFHGWGVAPHSRKIFDLIFNFPYLIFINFQALDLKFVLAIKPKTFEARGLSFWNLASFLFMGSQQSPFNISNSSSDKEKITKLYHDKY